MPTAVKLFISYSHKDETLKVKLVQHLSLLQHRGVIALWHDRKIAAGSHWAGEIDKNLKDARVILLLVSANFLNSDYCFSVEMECALQRHKAGEALVVPIILRPVEWRDAPFGELQALPKDGRPVTKWKDRDEAFADIAKNLRLAIETLSAGSAGHGNREPRIEVRPPDPPSIRAVVVEYAREYERIRLRMEPGDERTRILDAVFMKMRSLVCSTHDLLGELTVSPSPGERLVAVAALQVRPDPRYIDFLGERVATEKPFVGYQAALALLVAVRTLDGQHHVKLLPAITQGLEALRVIPGHTDRARVLKAALRELPKDKRIQG